MPDGTIVDVTKRTDGLYNVIPVDEGPCYWGLTAEAVEQLFTTVERSKTVRTVEPTEEIEDFLATSLKAEAVEANKEKRFVALPVKPWVDGRRETFLNLYGSLLNAKGAQGVNLRKGETLDEYAARHKNDESPVTHLPQRCHHCELWVTVLHDVANCPSKLAAKVADDQRKEKEKRNRERKLYQEHVAKTLIPYLGAIRERHILTSRGSVTQAEVEQLDGKMVRKLSHKLGKRKALKIWGEVTKENTCQQEPLLEHQVVLEQSL